MLLFRHSQSWLLYGLLFLSGCTGLAYEFVWTRMLTAGLGHEVAAILAVVSAFFTGLALGAWSMGGIICRSSRPVYWYAGLEAAIGVWAVILAVSSSWIKPLAFSLLGSEPSSLHHWAMAFLFPLVLLLPATMAMGATLPAMEQIVSRVRNNGCTVGGLYAVNTLGAVGGICAATLWLAPAMGFTTTQLVLAVINLFCAAAVLLIGVPPARRPPSTRVGDRHLSVTRLYITFFMTGLLGIGYEVAIIRLLSQSLENTIYSFAAMVSVFLLGTGIGAAVYQFFSPYRHYARTLNHLLLALTTICLVNLFWLHEIGDLYLLLTDGLGRGMGKVFIVECGVALAVFLLPTIAMGATFSHLSQAAVHTRKGLGPALGSNTLGASLAAVVFGVLVLPGLGFKYTLLVLSLAYILLCPVSPWRQRALWLIPLVMGIVLSVGPFPVQEIISPSGGRIVAHTEGVMASVTVAEDARGHRHLKVNNHFQMGGTSSVFSDFRQGHIPLLLHPNPKKGLFLGLGTGATFATAAHHPGLEATAVELVPEVAAVLPLFSRVNGDLLREPRLSVEIADARRYVRTTGQRYDVIVADLFHPARDGAGFLYTVEHFEAIAGRLADGGIFCQWLPVYQLDLATIRIILRTFLHVFPEGSAYLAHYSIQAPIIGLVAGVNGPVKIQVEEFSRRLESARLRDRLHQIRMKRIYDLAGCYLADHRQMARFAASGPLNTDDRPVVMFQAPQFTYASDEPGYKRLLALIDAFQPEAADLIQAGSSGHGGTVMARLANFWQARNDFIHAGVDVPRSKSAGELLSHVRGPLLAIVEQSPEFEAAYLPLLAIARQLHATDPKRAEQLLTDLIAANPFRDDAAQLRQNLYHSNGHQEQDKPPQG